MSTDKLDKAKEATSVNRSRGMTVAPSPLNGVKLDLGIILTVGVLLLLVQGRLVDSLLLQFLLIFSYSLLGTIWIIVRARQVVARVERERKSTTDDAQQE